MKSKKSKLKNIFNKIFFYQILKIKNKLFQKMDSKFGKNYVVKIYLKPLKSMLEIQVQNLYILNHFT